MMTDSKFMRDMYGATHFAKLPDDTQIYYKVVDREDATVIEIWLPISGMWVSPGIIPYSLKLI